MSEGWSTGSSRAWRRLRAQVLARDGYQCRAHPSHCAAANAKPHVCTKEAPATGGPGVAGHAHHTKGKAVTGDDPRFLVAACPACNTAIGDPNAGPDPAPRPVTSWG